MLVVLDCNIWLSLALNQQITYLDHLINTQNITIVTCRELINELTEVSSRSKFRKYFTIEYAEELIFFHQAVSRLLKLNDIPNIVIDQKDNYLFALCEVSNADYFITGDKLLLEVGSYKRTSIITLAEFKNLLAQ